MTSVKHVYFICFYLFFGISVFYKLLNYIYIYHILEIKMGRVNNKVYIFNKYDNECILHAFIYFLEYKFFYIYIYIYISCFNSMHEVDGSLN